MKKKDAARKTTEYGDAKSFGILSRYTNAEDFELIQSYVQSLRDDQKRVDVLFYISSKKSKEVNIPFDFVTSSDLDFWGNWKNDVVSKFVNEKFDYLLVLNTHRDTYLRNLLAQSQSYCRIGLYQKECEDYFELMLHLNGETNLKNLMRQIDHNLKHI